LICVLLVASCTLTPDEEEVLEDPSIKVAALATPEDIHVTYDSENRQDITVMWNAVENATYYVVAYQKGTAYASGESWIEVISSTCEYTFTFDSDEDDKRYVFKVKACMSKDDGSTAYSDYTDVTEGAVVDKFKSSYVIQDGKAILTSSYNKIDSVLPGEAKPIVNITVKYFDGDAEITDPSNFPTTSNTTYSLVSRIYLDGIEIDEDTDSLKFTTSVVYLPSQASNLRVVSNETGQITLTWDSPALNNGLEDRAKLSFMIQKNDGNTWSDLKDADGNIIYIANDDGTAKEMTYTDTAVESGVSYDYRVVAVNVFKENDGKYMADTSNAPECKGAHTLDTAPESFKASQGEKTTDDAGNAKYPVTLTLETYHSDLNETTLKMRVSRLDSLDSLASYVQIWEQTPEADRKSYTIEDVIELTAEEDKILHQYKYKVEFFIDGTDEPLCSVEPQEEVEKFTFTAKTDPTVKQFSMIDDSSFTATTDKADAITLNWKLAITGAEGLSTSNVIVTATRTTSSGDSKTIEIGKGEETYDDSDVEPGVTYRYSLTAKYEDSSSEYNGQVDVSDTTADGKILPVATNLNSVINEYSDKIVITWDEAEGVSEYIVLYREAGSTDEPTQIGGTFKGTEATISDDSLNCNKAYEFFVATFDGTNHTNYSMANKVKGKLFPLLLKPTVTNKAKSITVTIGEMEENMRSCAVEVYYKDSSGNYQYVTSSTSFKNEGSYTFDSEDAEELSGDGLALSSVTYPLSQCYYFVIVPTSSNGETISEGSKKTAMLPSYLEQGSWILPPTDITASKAMYSDMIKVTWNSLSAANTYGIYRRETGDVEWGDSYQQVRGSATTFSDLSQTGEYEYAVSAFDSNGNEGPLQTKFISENNVGYQLNSPSTFTGEDISELSEDIIEIIFSKVKGATSYVVTIGDNSYTVEVENMPTSSSGMTKGTYYLTGEFIHLFVARPKLLISPFFVGYASIYSLNDNSVRSSTKDVNFLCDNVKADEIVSFANWVMSPAFIEANADSYGNNWWGGPGVIGIGADAKKTGSTADGKVTYTGSYESSGAGQSQDIAGSVEFLSGYNRNGYYLTGTLIPKASDGGNLGYLGDDPLNDITGSVTMTLPYDYGSATVTYTSYTVSSPGGTASVSWTNGDGVTTDLGTANNTLITENIL